MIITMIRKCFLGEEAGEKLLAKRAVGRGLKAR